MLEQLFIERPKVADLIYRAVLIYPLVILNAPVGYGKTTVANEVRRYFERTEFFSGPHAPTPAATFYMSVNYGESNPEFLWEKHSSILTSQKSPLSGMAGRLPNPFNLRERSALIDEARRITSERPTLLVIDDFHFARDRRYAAFFSRIVKAGLPGLRLMILSRVRPNLPLEEMRVKGQCRVFGPETLAFSLPEAKCWLTGLGLHDDDFIQTAWQNSEGWPAALRLEAEEYLQTGRPADDGRYHHLLDQGFFSALSESEKGLLTRLAVFDEFTEEQALFISGDPGVSLMLLRFRTDNAFVSYDPKTRLFRLHSLLRSYCRARLKNAGPEQADRPRLYRLAGQWCLEHDDPAGAIKFLSNTGSSEDLSSVLSWYENYDFNRRATIKPDEESASAMLGLPWPLKLLKPLGYLAFLQCYGVDLEPRAALGLVAEAERRFAEAGYPEDIRRQVFGRAAWLRGILCIRDLSSGLASFQTARKILGRGLAAWKGDLPWFCDGPHAGFTLLRTPGGYWEQVELTERSWPELAALSNSLAPGGATLARAEYFLETGRLAENVEDLADQAAQEASCRGETPLALAAGLIKLRLWLAQGRGEQAADFISAQLESRETEPMLEEVKAYINCCLGRPEEIPDYLACGHLPPLSERQPRGVMFSRHIQGRAMLLNGEYARVMGLAQYLRPVLRKRAGVFGLLQALLLETVAAWNLGQTEKALKTLSDALALARPDRLVLPVAEFGALIKPVLKIAAVRGDEFIGRCYKAVTAYAKAYPARGGKTGAHFGFTARELQIIEMVIKGLNNRQIAESLAVQRVTVTKALSNVYRKLGVKNRTQATSRLLGAV